MKKTKYFNSVEEVEQYYGSLNNIPSGDLVVVVGENEQVLFSTSNNLSASGQMQDMGGYNIDADDREKIDYSYGGVVDWYAYGASMSYVADYVSTYGGGQAPDMSAYVSKVELSNCGYVTAQDVPAPDLSAYATKWDFFGTQGSSFFENNNTYVQADSSYVLFSNQNTHTYYPNGKINFSSEKFLRYYYPSGVETKPHSIDSINKDIVFSADSSSNMGGYPHKQLLIAQTGYVFVSGIGGATDSNISSNSVTTDMSLQAVINDIQTTLGTANSLAELIIGQE